MFVNKFKMASKYRTEAENLARAKRTAMECAEESFRKLDVNGDGKI